LPLNQRRKRLSYRQVQADGRTGSVLDDLAE
jgi:hypothetical protein